MNEEEFDKIMLSIRKKGIQNRIIIIMNPCCLLYTSRIMDGKFLEVLSFQLVFNPRINVDAMLYVCLLYTSRCV